MSIRRSRGGLRCSDDDLRYFFFCFFQEGLAAGTIRCKGRAGTELLEGKFIDDENSQFIAEVVELGFFDNGEIYELVQVGIAKEAEVTIVVVARGTGTVVVLNGEPGGLDEEGFCRSGGWSYWQSRVTVRMPKRAD